jgi:hypothetical protein
MDYCLIRLSHELMLWFWFIFQCAYATHPRYNMPLAYILPHLLEIPWDVISCSFYIEAEHVSTTCQLILWPDKTRGSNLANATCKYTQKFVMNFVKIHPFQQLVYKFCLFSRAQIQHAHVWRISDIQFVDASLDFGKLVKFYFLVFHYRDLTLLIRVDEGMTHRVFIIGMPAAAQEQDGHSKPKKPKIN